jgi:hypothetical protein
MKGIYNVGDLLKVMEENKSVEILSDDGECEAIATYNSVADALKGDGEDVNLLLEVCAFKDDYCELTIWCNVRRCEICGKVMTEGYIVGDGMAYYCSDECLHKVYTPEEWEEMYENGEGYWTDWY